MEMTSSFTEIQYITEFSLFCDAFGNKADTDSVPPRYLSRYLRKLTLVISGLCMKRNFPGG